jgi:hypothetical protein
MAWTYGQYIWNYLMQPDKIQNEYGVAGLMGNLVAESGLLPFRLQGDMDSAHDYPASQEYTADVNDGTISEYTFVNDYKGYGLAQWTIPPRKQGLYNYTRGNNLSVSDIEAQLDFLWHELETDYFSVLRTLVLATSIREASDVVLHDFENPQVQTEAVEIYRANLGIEVYNTYSGQPPEPPIPPVPPTPTRKGMPLYFYMGKRFKRKKGLIN